MTSHELTWRFLGQMLTPDSRAEFCGKLLLLEMNSLNVR